MKIWVALLSVPIVLAACSQAHVSQRSRIASGELVTCRQVTPTGSHMPRKICTSAAERKRQEHEGKLLLEEERRRRAAEDAMRDSMRREPSMGPNR